MIRLYLAAPLFSAAERAFNIALSSKLEDHCRVFLPQRDGGLLPELLQRGLDSLAARRLVFERDISAIREANLIVAVLDGRVVDEGVAVELGVAFGLGKCCWGLKTDVRSLSSFGDNPMVEVILARLFLSQDDLLRALEEQASVGPVQASSTPLPA